MVLCRAFSDLAGTTNISIISNCKWFWYRVAILRCKCSLVGRLEMYCQFTFKPFQFPIQNLYSFFELSWFSNIFFATVLVIFLLLGVPVLDLLLFMFLSSVFRLSLHLFSLQRSIVLFWFSVLISELPSFGHHLGFSFSFHFHVRRTSCFFAF